MKTYTSAITEIQTLAQNTTAEALVSFKLWYNQSIRTVASLRNGRWKWLETTTDLSTVASQRNYQLPNKYRKLVDLYITVGTTIYRPIPIYDAGRWERVLQAQLGESDQTLYYYVENSKIQLAPIPATSSNTITVRGRLNLADDLIADYTTGGILTATANGTALVGTGTTWTAAMAGRYIQIAESDTANKGDGFWYEIASVTDATNLTLTKPYLGTAITAGNAAYTIGQVPPIPESYQDAPIYRTLASYWTQHGNAERAKMYWLMYDGGKEAGFSDDYGGIVGQMLEEAGETVEGAYIPPDSHLDVNTSYYYPYQDASGFS